MSFFRRDRNSVDEYSQARRDLAYLRSDKVEESSSQEQVEEVTSETDASNGSASEEDLLATYREGATTVARDTSFSGKLQSEGNLCIEGNFEGELLSSATVFIAEGAKVEAEVDATDMIVAGEFDGTVEVKGRFHATPTARVSGEINSSILVIEQGSRINCQFDMSARKDLR